MSLKRHIPAYVHHKPSGQARVRIDGKDHYLGKYDSEESKDKYDDLIADYLGKPRKKRESNATINMLLISWWAECKRRYTKGKGKLGGAQNWRGLIRLLRVNHGEELIEDFGPKKLRALLERETETQGWSRRYALMQLARARQIFQWGVGEEMVEPEKYLALKETKLRNGHKTGKIPPVGVKTLARTLRHLPPKIAAMVRLQRLTGMRPGELVRMKPGEIDRSGDVWVYVPGTHKTEHKGKDRIIFIGPRAQRILAPWILKAGEGFVSPSKGTRCYTPDSYRRAIHRVCEAYGIERWSPHQIRKASATRIRAALDVESAASVLGHSSATVTGDHYAAADRQRAIEAVRKLG